MSMDLITLLNNLVASIATLQLQLADAQAALDAEKKASYDKGFADGVASVNPSSDKIYSQAELDAKLAEALLPLQLKIEELEKKVTELEIAQDAKVNAFKAELLAKYEAQQVAESEGETGFKDLLK